MLSKTLKRSYLGWLDAVAMKCLFDQFEYPCEYYKLLEAYPELHRFLKMWTIPELWFNLKFSISSDPTKMQFIGCDQPSTHPRSDLPSGQLVNYEILRPKNYTLGPTIWFAWGEHRGIMGVAEDFDRAMNIFLDDVDSRHMNKLIDKYAWQFEDNTDRDAFIQQDNPKNDPGFLEWLMEEDKDLFEYTDIEVVARKCKTGSIDGPNGRVYFIEVPTTSM